MKADPTYAEIVTTYERYDKAMEQQCVNLVVGEAHTVSEKAVVCSNSKMWQKGTLGRALLDKPGEPGEGAAEACGKEQRPKEDSERAIEKTTTAEIPSRTWSIAMCAAQKDIAHSSALNEMI